MKSYQAFREKSDKHEFFDFMVEQKDKLNLTSCRSCLSIGAGFGDTDIFTIKTLMPSLTSYIAVEKDSNLFVSLSERMNQFASTRTPPLQVTLHEMDAEEWEGPAEAVDVIVLHHILHYMKDPVALLKRCRSWLAPGGTLWITSVRASNMAELMNKHFNIESTTAFSIVPVLEFVKMMDFKMVQTFAFQEEVNLSEVNRSLVSFCLFREASEEDEKIFLEMIDKEFGNDKVQKFVVQSCVCKI